MPAVAAPRCFGVQQDVTRAGIILHHLVFQLLALVGEVGQTVPSVGPLVALAQRHRLEIILPCFRVFGLALEGDGDGGGNRGFIRRVPRLGDGDIALVGDHLKGVGHGVGAVAPLVLGGVGLVVEVVGITASLYRFLHEVCGINSTVLTRFPVGLQLTHPVLAQGQAGDGAGALRLVRVVVGGPVHADDQVLAVRSLYRGPSAAILLPLNHKADRPLIIGTDGRPGAVLVVAVVPDLLDGQALEVQVVGGDVAVLCKGHVLQNAVTGGRIVVIRCCIAGTAVLNRDFNRRSADSNRSLYHPVLQEQEFARVDRFARRLGIACSSTRRIVSQNRRGQAGEAAAPCAGIAQTTGYGFYEFVAAVREELFVVVFQNFLEILVGVGPFVVTRWTDLHLEGDGHIFA